MPTAYKKKVFTNTSANVLNAIRNSATTNYKDYVPYAQPNANSIKSIGSIIMDNPQIQNEFVQALINRIGMVLIQNKVLENSWSIFKKGIMEYGEIVEQVFVDIAKPFTYDTEVAENEIYKRVIPDIKSQFYIVNFQKFYKATVEDDTLRKAFLTENGLLDLTDKIIASLVNGEVNDELLVMKYMLAKNILNGKLKAVEVPSISSANAKSIVSTIKGVSNKMTFPNTNYNQAGVTNQANKDEQYLICNSDFDSIIDVEVLASAFNMDKAEFTGHRMLVDGFGQLDNARLDLLFGNDSDYEPLTDEELEVLDTIPAVLIDKDYFVLLDNKRAMTSKYNEQGLYWNYWLHTWKTFGVSAFSQAVVFVPTESAVTSVAVTPSTITAGVGTTFNVTATVETTGFADKAVNWTSNNAKVKVTNTGIVTIGEGATGTAIITATSVADDTKYGTCTVTINSGGGTVTPAVESVNVYPSAITLTENSTFEINAVVVTQGEINKGVTWTSSNEGVTITNSNAVTGSDTDVTTITATVNVAEGATGTATITATSIGDTTKTDTCTVTINSGGGGGTFDPEMTPLTISATSNGVTKVAGKSVLTVPQGANYAVSIVNLTIPHVETDFHDNSIYSMGYAFAHVDTSWVDSDTTVKGLKITPDNTYFDTVIEYIGTQGAEGYTATGTATVTITDLDNGTSAVKEITVNFTRLVG